jgi:hypothetical protein
LRLLKTSDNIDLQLSEYLDHARILYNKGLKLQSLKILEKAKELAKANHKFNYLAQVISLEKKIETLHITRSMQDRADQLTEESRALNIRLASVTELSNLALQLYSWYIKNGHARNEEDEKALETFFKKHLTDDLKEASTFYQKLYLYQCYCWYAFIRQDFLMYYRYTQKWVDVFYEEPVMVAVETAHYIKGMHNLLTAHFNLSNYNKFDKTLSLFEEFAESDIVKRSDNNSIQVFVYLYTAKINQHFMKGSFDEGLNLVPTIKDKLNEYALYLDRHRVLVFHYKIASLYFGSGNYDQTILYLNKIINWKLDLRSDIQCYARLLHLIAHYELKNYDILEYLVKSVYRFMSKMENLSIVEVEIFKFIRKSFSLSAKELKPAFIELYNTLKTLQNNTHAVRAFSYLDIISWLESKIYDKQVQEVIKEKYVEASKKNNEKIKG